MICVAKRGKDALALGTGDHWGDHWTPQKGIQKKVSCGAPKRGQHGSNGKKGQGNINTCPFCHKERKAPKRHRGWTYWSETSKASSTRTLLGQSHLVNSLEEHLDTQQDGRLTTTSTKD